MPVPVKVDEDLPADIASLVSAAGYDATTVYGQGHTGLPDEVAGQVGYSLNLIWQIS